MSDLESESTNSFSESESDSSEESSNGEIAYGGEFRPYADEPLAHNEGQHEQGAARVVVEDEDGIPPATLEARSLRTIPLESW